MNKLKFLSLFAFSLMGLIFFAPRALAQETDLSNVSAEFELDEIQAEDLDIKEPIVLPGDSGYWWQNLKENIGLFFTFDEQKRVEKMEQNASRRIIEAKKLSASGTANAADRVSEALTRYQDLMDKLRIKFETNPDLKEKMLEKFDANALRHQEVLTDVIEKLNDKASAEQIQNLERIREQSSLNWYKVNKETIQERLENAIEKNNSGSKFRQIKNIAVLEQLADILPDEAGDQIEAAKVRAEEKLADKINNLSNAEKDEMEKYIDNIAGSRIVKQKMLSNMSEADALPQAIRNRLENIASQSIQALKEEFENMETAEQEEFLEQFENNAHPIYLQLLKEMPVTDDLKNTMNQLRERQEEQIRTQIEQTSDPIRLRNMEMNLENSPALRRQAQEQRREVTSDDQE
ncbi:MAG: DUF5667 domain-containing protein [bacterium]|nr:DUF5667 domain-containing protein [bacterium]